MQKAKQGFVLPTGTSRHRTVLANDTDAAFGGRRYGSWWIGEIPFGYEESGEGSGAALYLSEVIHWDCGRAGRRYLVSSIGPRDRQIA